MIRQSRNFHLLTALSALMGVSTVITNDGQTARSTQPSGHRSSQGSTNVRRGLTGPTAKRAEKRRRRLTRRNSQ